MSPGDHLWPLPESRADALRHPGRHRKAGWLSAVLVRLREAVRRYRA